MKKLLILALALVTLTTVSCTSRKEREKAEAEAAAQQRRIDSLQNALNQMQGENNDINQTLRLQPKDPDYLLNRASFYIDRKQYELAKL